MCYCVLRFRGICLILPGLPGSSQGGSNDALRWICRDTLGKFTKEEREIQLAAAKGIRTIHMRMGHRIAIQGDSVYTAAVAFPQIARSAGWALHYTGHAIRSQIFLLMNIFLQMFFLYMLTKSQRVVDKFGGQMYLCDFGANLPSCPDAPNCVGPGGTLYSAKNLYDWDLWVTRSYVKNSLKAIFPEMVSKIDASVIPGEYGVEDYYLRITCCFLFVLGLWPDLAGTSDLWSLLFRVPTSAESWICSKIPEGGCDPTSVELDFVSFKIAGIPLHWKFLNLLFVCLPKLYLWIMTLDVGIVFLMETSTIEDLLLNCVALSFILGIDELTMSMLTAEAQQLLTVLEDYECSQPDVPEDEDLMNHQLDKHWSVFGLSFWIHVIPWRLAAMLGIMCFFIRTYYADHCRRLADGSVVSGDIHLPVHDRLALTPFLLGIFPGLHAIETRSEVIWTMPEQTET